MSRPIPPSPAIGDKFYHDGPGPNLYHVRAVVDERKLDDGTPWYQVVMRYWSPRKGWRYVIENCTVFAYDLYTPEAERKKARSKASVQP